MLDECKGEKFEEVICGLALAVLRKVVYARNDGANYRSVTNRSLEEHLLPLILAYRGSLREHLIRIRKLHEDSDAYSRQLEGSRIAIERRRESINALPGPAADPHVIHLAQSLLASWDGDVEWAKIIGGESTSERVGFLEMSFEVGHEAVCQGQNIQGHQGISILEYLDTRIATQEARLKRWRTFRASLENAQSARKPRSNDKADSTVKPEFPPEKFTKHQSLRLPTLIPSVAAKVRCRTPSHSTHQVLLDSMRAELGNTRMNMIEGAEFGGRPSGDTYTSQPKRLRTARHSDGSAQSRELLETHNRLATGRFIEENVRSTDKLSTPKSQVTDGIIELLNSPSLAIGSSENAIDSQDLLMLNNQEGGRERVKVAGNESDPSRSHPKFPITSGPNPDSNHDLCRSDHTSGDTQLLNRGFGNTGGLHSGKTETTVSPHLANPSLRSLPETPFETSAATASISDDGHEAQESVPRLSILLGRTRQSMSLLPKQAPSQRTREPNGKASLSSQISLANGIETPRKPGEGPTAPYPQSGSSTPRDQLFNEDADYASVFKSRPRLAMSPVLSPERSALSLSSMLEEI